MGDVLNVLISIIPIFVGIIWFLQLLARLRRRRKASTAEGAPRGLASKRGEPKSSTSMRAGKKLDELASKRHEIPPKSEQMAGFHSVAKSGTKEMSPVDSLSSLGEKGKPPNRLSEEKPLISPLEQGQRVVKDKPARAETSTVPVGRNLLDSIRARSPLAQAMLWKTILDRPLALKETDE